MHWHLPVHFLHVRCEGKSWLVALGLFSRGSLQVRRDRRPLLVPDPRAGVDCDTISSVEEDPRGDISVGLVLTPRAQRSHHEVRGAGSCFFLAALDDLPPCRVVFQDCFHFVAKTPRAVLPPWLLRLSLFTDMILRIPFATQASEKLHRANCLADVVTISHNHCAFVTHISSTRRTRQRTNHATTARACCRKPDPVCRPCPLGTYAEESWLLGLGASFKARK